MKYQRKKFHELSAPHRVGMIAERALAQIFERYGRDVQRTKYAAPYDMLVDDWRIDVKAATGFQTDHGPTWTFRSMRGSRVENCDFYALRLLNVPFRRNPLHLLLRAPIEASGIYITFSSLLSRHLQDVLAFSEFCHGQYGRKQIAA